MRNRPKGSIAVQLWTFRSGLGWTGIAGRNGLLARLVFGHATRRDAQAALEAWVADNRASQVTNTCWNEQLVDLLCRYSEGAAVSFDKVALDESDWTAFQKRALPECRRVPYGQRASYGQLAQRMGRPRAARAVGHAMAHNPVPLVVPCHRVVASDGGLRGFGAEGGVAMKQRLLNMEQRATAPAGNGRT